jgi:hypothetical protein
LNINHLNGCFAKIPPKIARFINWLYELLEFKPINGWGNIIKSGRLEFRDNKDTFALQNLKKP